MYTLTLTVIVEYRTGYAAKYGDLPNNREVRTILTATADDADVLRYVAEDLQSRWKKPLTATIVDKDGNPPPERVPTRKVRIGGAYYNIDADLVDHPYVDEVIDEQ
tara:strand:- start:5586 stop:5903 length:318 start_codon:yes stop_codon:yes gene_type:complete